MNDLIESFNLVCSILDELAPIELTPRDKLDDMLVKNPALKNLIHKFELTL